MGLMRRLAPLRAVAGFFHGARAFGGPVQANIEMTGRCNIRCIHCYYHSPIAQTANWFDVRYARRRGTPPPDAAELERRKRCDGDAGRIRGLIGQLLRAGTRRFLLSGAGEPFLHAPLRDHMQQLKRGDAYGIVNTNGTLLTREWVDALLAMRYDELRVTLLAGTPAVYAATHPGSPGTLFERIRENLLYLAERKRALNQRTPKLLLPCVVIKQNLAGLADFARFAAEVRADEVVFRPVDDLDDSGLHAIVPEIGDEPLLRAQLAEAAAHLDAHGVRHNIPVFLSVHRERFDTSALYRVIPCYYPWLVCRIEVEGAAYACCRCYRALGNVYEQGFDAVWHGPEFRRLRRAAITLNRRDAPVESCDCHKCCHYSVNLNVFRKLHPLRGRSGAIKAVASVGDAD